MSHNPIPRRGLLAIAMMLEIADTPGPTPVYSILSTGLSPASNEQLVRQLRDADLLRGVRGPGGGVALARPACQITFGEIVGAVVDPDDPIDQRDQFARAASHITSGMCYAFHDSLGKSLEAALNDARNAGIVQPRQARQPPQLAPQPAQQTRVKMPTKPASVFNFGG